MSKKLIYLLLIVIAVSSSCGSKKSVEDNRPSWVKNRPISNSDYVGVGKSSKIKLPYKYLQEAKNNALNDISSEISVNISSTSVLSSLETPTGFVDTYSSLIKSKAKSNLEGYELISTYETNTDYWCYYKLNKIKYSNILNEKKKVAIKKSLDFYNRCKSSEKNTNLKKSIVLNIKAIDTVKNYWGEELKVEIDGRNVFLGNELITNVSRLIAELRVKQKYKQIDGVRGKNISNESLSFIIENFEGDKQAGIPIIFGYSDGRLSKNKRVSDNEGKVSYRIKKLNTDKNIIIFACKVDVSSIIDEVTGDYLLHKLLDRIPVSNAKIEIKVRNPVIYINSEELLLGRKNKESNISYTLSEYLIKKGIKTTSIKSESDFEIIIEADTKEVSRNSDRVYTSELNVHIEMISENRIVYSSDIKDFYGRGNSYSNASEDAYSKVGKDVRVKVGNQIYRYIKD